MISWKLWTALRKPFVAHPIYQLRGVWKWQPPRRSLWYSWLQHFLDTHQAAVGLVTLALAILITMMLGPAPLLILFFGVPFLLLFVGLPLLLASVGTFYGMAAAMMVSDAIANEQLQGRYVLLGATPYGLVGATWALCSLEFHRHEMMTQIRSTLSSIYIMLMTFMGFPMVFTLLLFVLSPSDPNSQTHFSGMLRSVIFALIPAVDYIQSTNMGCLIGMIVPMHTTGRANARALAMGIFLAVQFGAYMLVVFLCFVALPSVFIQQGWELNVIFDFFRFAILYICRDMVILILWVVLAHSLDSHLDELEAVTKVGVTLRFPDITRPPFIHNILRRRSNTPA